jgi:hypothetical protein
MRMRKRSVMESVPDAAAGKMSNRVNVPDVGEDMESITENGGMGHKRFVVGEF